MELIDIVQKIYLWFTINCVNIDFASFLAKCLFSNKRIAKPLCKLIKKQIKKPKKNDNLENLDIYHLQNELIIYLTKPFLNFDSEVDDVDNDKDDPSVIDKITIANQLGVNLSLISHLLSFANYTLNKNGTLSNVVFNFPEFNLDLKGSSYEILFESYLIKYINKLNKYSNSKFKYQKEYPHYLPDRKYPVRYDFAIFILEQDNYELFKLIEIHGKQHYITNYKSCSKFYKSQKDLSNSHRRDKLKEENAPTFLTIIPYYNVKPKKLTEILKQLIS